MVVPHYFGRAQSLEPVRAWCHARSVVLIEDCAHALFGQAGERPIGAWGDYATASLTKFLPVPEAGLIASASWQVPEPPTRAPSARQQLKAWVDVMDRRSGGSPGMGLRNMLGRLFGPGARALPTGVASKPDQADAVASMMAACDMGRVDQRTTWLASALARHASLAPLVHRRRANFDRLAAQLKGLPGTRSIWAGTAGPAVPYVYPLWVEEPDAVYAALRRAGAAVLRWDRVWPGAPTMAGDHGALWRRHVLQLLCHQSLSDDDIDATAAILQAGLRGAYQ